MSKKRRQKTQRARLRNVDLAALEAIASRAVPRTQLLAGSWLSLALSTDLFHYGYAVRHWLRLADGCELLEYRPRLSDLSLPRLTACDYREQCAIHLALGLNVVPPGAPWRDYGHKGLFDDLLITAATAAAADDEERGKPHDADQQGQVA